MATGTGNAKQEDGGSGGCDWQVENSDGGDGEIQILGSTGDVWFVWGFSDGPSIDGPADNLYPGFNPLRLDFIGLGYVTLSGPSDNNGVILGMQMCGTDVTEGCS